MKERQSRDWVLVYFVWFLIVFLTISFYYTVVIVDRWYATWYTLIQFPTGHFLFFMVVYSYYKVSNTEAGIPESSWVPLASEEKLEEAKELAHKGKRRIGPKGYGPQAVRYCRTCQRYKPPRSHHCKDCGICTLKMDHHCPWVGTCVGHHNHKYFLNFIIITAFGLTYAMLAYLARILGIILKYHSNVSKGLLGLPEPLHILILIGINVCVMLMVLIGLWILSIYQVSLITVNCTTIEEFEYAVAKRRAYRLGEPYHWYYNVGWRRNLAEVFGSKRPLDWFAVWKPPRNGDGCEFPLNPHLEPT